MYDACSIDPRGNIGTRPVGLAGVVVKILALPRSVHAPCLKSSASLDLNLLS